VPSLQKRFFSFTLTSLIENQSQQGRQGTLGWDWDSVSTSIQEKGWRP